MKKDKIVKSILTLRENFQQYTKMYDSSIELVLEAVDLMPDSPSDSCSEPLSDNQAALLKFVSNVEDCKVVDCMLSHCKNNESLVKAFINLDAEGYIDWQDMNNNIFRTTILPILKYKTTSDAIRKAMIRAYNK